MNVHIVVTDVTAVIGVTDVAAVIGVVGVIGVRIIIILMMTGTFTGTVDVNSYINECNAVNEIFT